MHSPIRIVVTGVRGQVAEALQMRAQYARRPLEIVRLGRPTLDLERLETIPAALAEARPDILVSAAAYTAVDHAEKDAEKVFLTNATAAGVLAEETARRGIPIIHFSTDYVFDGSKSSAYVETDVPNPRTIYGAAKLEGEWAVAEANRRHLILRTAWVYGPHGRNFVRTMLKMAEARAWIGVVSDQIGNPTYSLDIAQAVLAVGVGFIEGKGRPGTYHLAGAGAASWAEFAQAIFEGSRLRGGAAAVVEPISTEAYPTPALRPKNSSLDCTKIQDEFNIMMPSWQDSLEGCLDLLCL